MLRGFVAVATALLLALLASPEAAAQVRSHVQVVAHPDDDILFMNPDLAISIRSGATVTTVFLTAGESDVRPTARYAAQRQAGARSAFATMAGASDAWDRAALSLPGGRQAELQTLRERPRVRLVFLNLPDDNDPHALGGRQALTRLWHDETVQVATVLPEGSVLPGTSSYDRAAVTTALAQLYRQFAPTIVRTHDPEPDVRYQSQWGKYHNHPDHVMSARFAELAMPAAGARSAHLVHYRDYNIADAPPNLPPEIVADKRAIFERYAVHDAVVGLDEPYATWLRSMRHRWSWRSNWVTTGRGGQVTCVFVRGGRLIRATGSRESIVDTPGFVPRDGSVVFADSDTLLAQDRHTGTIFLKWKDSRWKSLGAPPAGGQLTQVGPPAATVTPDGRTLVAVRNASGGASIRFTDRPGWIDLGGTGVDDVVSVLVTGTGVHVLAAGRDALLHWRLDDAGRGELVAPPEAHRPVGAIAVARGSRAFVAFREAATGHLVVLGEQAGWSVVARIDTTTTSDPALAVVRNAGRDTPIVAARDGTGRIAVFGPMRTVLPGQIVGQPAFTPDGHHLVALGDDGRTRVDEVKGTFHQVSW
ncbi:PIG-L family deacetylase [Saccharopolyspora sp. K220]|uniref:PIG-L family deacetylase n=1 Tax=Saccharopolyspora soli TaxID=2926618 RepID=UPI001F59F047|nr:PIG-L family deacetylase [Saccharopolyspora soli]MCI2422804.1 PIG-L family deacetylase [Saccharopolyspora soli]